MDSDDYAIVLVDLRWHCSLAQLSCLQFFRHIFVKGFNDLYIYPIPSTVLCSPWGIFLTNRMRFVGQASKQHDEAGRTSISSLESSMKDKHLADRMQPVGHASEEKDACRTNM